MYREQAIAVSPALHRHEAGSAAKFLEFGDPVFARILGVDGFTRAQFEPVPAYCHALLFEAHQMHFDAPVLRTVKRAVTKIRVNCLSPGQMETIRAPGRAPRPGNHLIPLGRRGGSEEIATAVRFLCSADSSFITGQTIHINGGQMMF